MTRTILKKKATFILMMLLAFAFSACSSDDNSDSSNESYFEPTHIGHYKGSPYIEEREEEGKVTIYEILTIRNDNTCIVEVFSDSEYKKPAGVAYAATYKISGNTVSCDDLFDYGVLSTNDGWRTLRNPNGMVYTKMSGKLSDSAFNATYRGKLQTETIEDEENVDVYVELTLDAANNFTFKGYSDENYTVETTLSLNDYVTTKTTGKYVRGYKAVAFVEISDDFDLSAYSTDDFETLVFADLEDGGPVGTLTKVTNSSNLAGQNESPVEEEEEDSSVDLDSPCTVAHFASRLKRLKETSSEAIPTIKVSVTDATAENFATITAALAEYGLTEGNWFGTPTLYVDLDLSQSTNLTEIPYRAFTLNKESDTSIASGTSVLALKGITLPASVKTIHPLAFWTPSLETATLNEGLETIWGFSFCACVNLKTVNIPSTVTYIGAGNFTYYGTPPEITLSSPEYKFESNFILSSDETELVCSLATGDVTIPNTVTYIHPSAFKGDRGITGITLPVPANGSKWIIADDTTIDVSSLSEATVAQYLTMVGDEEENVEYEKYAASPWAIDIGNWTESAESKLTGTTWWENTESSPKVTLAANQSVTYTFKSFSTNAACMVEAYDAKSYYLSTTTNQDAWTWNPASERNLLTNAGSTDSKAFKIGHIYSAEISYDGNVVTITYTDLGADGTENKPYFTTSTTGDVTAPVYAHIVAELGTFFLKTVTTGTMSQEDNFDGIYVALGGENTLNLTSVAIDGEPQAVTHSTLAPSTWYAISEFETAKLAKDSSVSFTFVQPTQGANAWNSWALAFYDKNNVGQFMRGDNWLNKSTDATFSRGMWNEGNSSANGTWPNGYTYETCASKLPADAVVVVTISYDGENVQITETVNGTLAYTTSSEKW